MKKIALLMSMVLLGACAGGGSGLMNGGANTTGIASWAALGGQLYVQNKCVNELQSRAEWRAIALTMTQQKQQEWENKICSCVSEEAPAQFNQLTAAELLQLGTETGRAQVMANVTSKTVTACYQKIFTK